MKNRISKYKDIVLKNWRDVIFFAVLIFLFFFAYSIYVLFNGSPDENVITKVEAENQVLNIKFDVKTINKIIGLKSYNPPAVNLPSKNPFQPY